MALEKEKQRVNDRHDELEYKRVLDFLEEQEQIPAIVVQVGGEWKVDEETIYTLGNKEYVLDLYGRGITRDSLGNLDTDPTKKGVLGQCLISTDSREKDAEVLVTMLGGRAYIRPQLLPADTGFGKVLMLVDDLNPGSWRADYVRFTGAAPES